ncbi:MAG: MFS transporter [Halococcoides sp.]
MVRSTVRDRLDAVFALDRGVIVLSVAMFAFSLAFQMTTRYLPVYLQVLGASGLIVGLFGTVGNAISALYPYPGGTISDRIGSRRALTLFGAIATLGVAIWLGASWLSPIQIGPIVIEPWLWVFVGLLLAQAWKSFGLGATFAVVRQATDPGQLAAGFASTESIRRLAFLIGPVLAAVLIGVGTDFRAGFRFVLAIAVLAGGLGTIVQHRLYDASADSIGRAFEGLDRIGEDLRAMPAPLRPLLAGDTLVRFGNGVIYVFLVLVVTQWRAVGLETTLRMGPWTWAIDLTPATFVGYLFGLEMLVAIALMVPAAAVADRIGYKPVVATGFAVYGLIPLALTVAPATPWAMIAIFAASGLRFAGLPAHKALIVGPAESGAGGRVTGTYYLVRNVVVIPSAALGGALWTWVAPPVALAVGGAIALGGTLLFVGFGEEPSMADRVAS